MTRWIASVVRTYVYAIVMQTMTTHSTETHTRMHAFTFEQLCMHKSHTKASTHKTPRTIVHTHARMHTRTHARTLLF